MTTVLVVEDEIEIARVVRDYLRNAGFEVIVVGDGGSAVASVRSSRPDLLVLDLGLPGRDGLDVAREIRRWSDTPIVMLTARGDETDRIVGLEIGADDYVVKPFSPRELVARVRAVLRRTRAAARGDEVVRAGDVEIDTAKMRVSVGGTHVDLTPTEFQLLATLAREPGRVFTRSQLLDAVHGVAIESYERAIDAHVKNIRRKIEPEPGSPRSSSRSTASAIGSPMPDQGHRHGPGPGFRPPWWPEGEAFPPDPDEQWRAARGRFLRRIALGIGLFLVFVFVVGWLGALFGGGFHRGGQGGRFFPGFWLIPLLLLVGFLVFGRAVRRGGADRRGHGRGGARRRGRLYGQGDGAGSGGCPGSRPGLQPDGRAPADQRGAAP